MSTMFLVQILLPLTDNSGRRFQGSFFHRIKQELTSRFKGLTVYSRAPAEGIWRPRKGVKRDEIIVFEVMVARLNRKWWKAYRKRLEATLRQESIVIRAQDITVL